MESGDIPDSAINASSSYVMNVLGPRYGRWVSLFFLVFNCPWRFNGTPPPLTQLCFPFFFFGKNSVFFNRCGQRLWFFWRLGLLKPKRSNPNLQENAQYFLSYSLAKYRQIFMETCDHEGDSHVWAMQWALVTDKKTGCPRMKKLFFTVVILIMLSDDCKIAFVVEINESFAERWEQTTSRSPITPTVFFFFHLSRDHISKIWSNHETKK